MKKIILSIVALALVTGVSAQEVADKKIQAGLVLGYGLSFQKMGTKILTNDGPGGDFTIGTNVNFSFGGNSNLGLNTGVEFDFGTLNYKSSGTDNVYYWYCDATILRNDETNTTTDELFLLTSRKQKPLYLTIPTMLIFRTNFIGYFRYFGKFGTKNSILLRQKVTDKGQNLDPNIPLGVMTAGENTDMTAPGDMFFFKSSVGLAGGAEWNFSGSTSLMAEIGYYYGFTPLHRQQKDQNNQTLFTSGLYNGSGTDEYFSNSALQQQLQFKVSVLF